MALPFSSGFNRYLARPDLSLKVSGAETASTTGSAVELGDAATVNIDVVVTAVGANTPTLLVGVQGSNDGVTYYTICTIGSTTAAFGNATAPTVISATGTFSVACPAARYMRYNSTIGGGSGSPTLTYSVAGSSV